MVLILDPYQELKELISKKSKLSDGDKIAALVKLYKKILIVPQDYLDAVDEIIIINFLGNAQISNSIFQKSLSKIKKRGKVFSPILEQLESALLFSFKTREEFYLFINSLIIESPKKQFIFFDILLTPLLPYVLFVCENLQGFRLLKNNAGSIKWEKIENINNYILCSITLVYKHFDKDVFELASIENQKEYLPGLTNQFINLVKEGMNHHIILFSEDDIITQSNFINNLNDELGDFYVHNCKTNGLIIHPDFTRYIIYGIDNLDESNRMKFLNSILAKPNLTKKIVIIVNKPIDISKFPSIRFWTEFYDDPSKIFVDYVLPIIQSAVEVFERKQNEYKKLFSLVYGEEYPELLNDLMENLFVMDISLYERGKVNFLYDLNLDELNNIVSDIKAFSKLIKKKSTIDEKIVHNIKITHDIQNSWWVINVNKLSPFYINYNKFIGIKYIAYLWKHYKNKSISDTELRKVVLKWHHSTKEIEINWNSAKNISAGLKYLFKEYSELAPLDPCIKISSNIHPGCYFQEIAGINLFIDDEQIPLPN